MSYKRTQRRIRRAIRRRHPKVFNLLTGNKDLLELGLALIARLLGSRETSGAILSAYAHRKAKELAVKARQ